MSNIIRESALALISSDVLPQDLKPLSPYIPHFQRYSTDSSLSSDHQFNASLLWLLTAREHKDPTLFSAYQHIADLFDQLALLGFDLWARRQVLDRLPSNLAISAAQCAIEHQDLELAVCLLDKCRGLGWRQMLRTLPPEDQINNLAEINPELGVPLRGWLRALHVSSMSHRANANRPQHVTQHEIDDHVVMARDAAELIVKVRAEVPGYEDFMNPDPVNNVRTLAEMAPVVVLIPDESSTHLILLRAKDAVFEYKNVKGLGLASLEAMVNDIKGTIHASGRLARGSEGEQVEEPEHDTNATLSTEGEDTTGRGFTSKWLRRNENTQQQISQVLSTLWDTLGVTIRNLLSHKSDSVSKIYLYPTGPLTRLPIHAAGVYTRSGGESLLDYFTPSYIASFQNLFFPSPTSLDDTMPLRVLAISQPNTPGQNPLPAAKTELEIIRKYVPSKQLLVAQHESGTKKSILSGPWVYSQDRPLVLHCACHAQQNLLDPLSSSIYLYDGEVKLSQLLGQRNKMAFLAVMSACETATGDESRPDEALHIGAALNYLQGFQSVIATMWAMHDTDGPVLAEAVYKTLFADGGKGRADPASMLRLAVTEMRRSGASLVRWVPFVHFGF